MTDQQPTMTPEEKALLRREKKLRYQRDYYLKMKNSSPEFMNRRRQTTKKHYNYKRTTVDCERCGIRHRVDSEKCILVKNAKMEIMKQHIIDTLEGNSTPPQP